MCNHNEACFHYDGYFQYHCPTCGLVGPRAKRAREAKRGWIAARDGRTHRCDANPSPLRGLSHAAPGFRLGSSQSIAASVPLAAGTQRRCKP